MESLGSALHALIGRTDRAVPPHSGRQTSVIYLDLRLRGIKCAATWGTGGSPLEALLNAVLASEAGRKSRCESSPEAAIVNVAYDFRELKTVEDLKHLQNLDRGRLGIELVANQKVVRLAPTEMSARNTDFLRGFDLLAAEMQINHGTDLDQRVRLFEAEQFYVRLDGKTASTTRLFRGAELVPTNNLAQHTVQNLYSLLSEWLFGNVHADGRMTYKYWPSRQTEATSNNAIRQWMASVALNRVAMDRNDSRLQALALRNLRYNLAASYQRDSKGRGLIFDGSTVKLGAVAIAALAILESPYRNEFKAELEALRKSVDDLWRPSGEFRTFLMPERRNDNQNFYPGEALLLWAELYARSALTNDPDQKLLLRFMKSVEYYRHWHFRNRNPAFVPWHTQAYYRVWQETKNPQLKQLIFEMNDWLVHNLAQWEEVSKSPDAMGRFYAAGRNFGPPHASSTGVYLEGLANAWELACETGDHARRELYRRAILRGVRSTLQLTFKNDVDMFYVSDRTSVRGGVRTNVYDNEIRVDNVQHNLMAIRQVLASFPPSEYLSSIE
jgi:hypothetical protein